MMLPYNWKTAFRDIFFSTLIGIGFTLFAFALFYFLAGAVGYE